MQCTLCMSVCGARTVTVYVVYISSAVIPFEDVLHILTWHFFTLIDKCSMLLAFLHSRANWMNHFEVNKKQQGLSVLQCHTKLAFAFIALKRTHNHSMLCALKIAQIASNLVNFNEIPFKTHQKQEYKHWIFWSILFPTSAIRVHM